MDKLLFLIVIFCALVGASANAQTYACPSGVPQAHCDAAAAIAANLDSYPAIPTDWPARYNLLNFLDQLIPGPNFQITPPYHPLLQPDLGVFISVLHWYLSNLGLDRLINLQLASDELAVLKLYSSGYAVKIGNKIVTFDISDAILPDPISAPDLVSLGASFFDKLADSSLATFNSHLHSDHTSVYLWAGMGLRGKLALINPENAAEVPAPYSTYIHAPAPGVITQVSSDIELWTYLGGQDGGDGVFTPGFAPISGLPDVYNNCFLVRFTTASNHQFVILHIGDHNLPDTGLAATLTSHPFGPADIMFNSGGYATLPAYQNAYNFNHHDMEFHHGIGGGWNSPFSHIQGYATNPPTHRIAAFWGEIVIFKGDGSRRSYVPTPTPTSTPSATPSPLPSTSSTPSPSPSHSPNPTPSASPSHSPNPSPLASASSSPNPSASPSHSPLPAPSASPSASSSLNPTPSTTPSVSPSPSSSPTPVPTSSAAPSVSPSASASPNISLLPQSSPEAAPSFSPPGLSLSGTTSLKARKFNFALRLNFRPTTTEIPDGLSCQIRFLAATSKAKLNKGNPTFATVSINSFSSALKRTQKIAKRTSILTRYFKAILICNDSTLKSSNIRKLNAR